MKPITSLMSQFKTDTQNGETLFFENCKGGYFSDKEEYTIEVFGKTDGNLCVRSGTVIKANGKNLCNSPHNRARNITNRNGLLNTAKRDLSEAEYIVGFTMDGYMNSMHVTEYSIIGNRVSVTNDNGGYGVSFPVSVFGAARYSLSYNILNGKCVYRIGFYSGDGYNLGFVHDKTFVTPQDCAWVTITISSEVMRENVTVENIQLELGENATNFENGALGGKIEVPCDLYEGDIWYPTIGKIIRGDNNIELYKPQKLFAPKGDIRVFQNPKELMAGLSATMLTARNI